MFDLNPVDITGPHDPANSLLIQHEGQLGTLHRGKTRDTGVDQLLQLRISLFPNFGVPQDRLGVAGRLQEPRNRRIMELPDFGGVLLNRLEFPPPLRNIA